MSTETIFDKRPVATLLFITTILIIILVLLLEVILRFTPYQVFVSKGQGGFPPMFIADEKAGFDLAENVKDGVHSTIDLNYPVHTNNIGCFDKKAELNKKHNILIGDSFTWGFEPLEKKWTTILEKNMKERFLKCGVMAYGPKQALVKLKKVIDKVGETPKTIIYAYYWNDLNDDHANPALTSYKGNVVNRVKSFNYKNGHLDYLSDKDIASNYEQYQKYGSPDYLSFSTSKKIKFWIKSHSIVANIIHNSLANNQKKIEKHEDIAKGSEALYQTYLSKMSSKQHPWLEKTWDKHLDNIKKMADYATSIDSRFMVVVLPTKAHVYSSHTPKEVITNLNDSQTRLITFFKNNKIQYLDLFEQFSKDAKNGKKLYLPNDLHFSIEGEALAGKMITNFIRKKSFLAPQNN